MPNTLTHIGVNGFLSKSVLKNSDLLWIYTGCIIPDFPWITMRLAELFFSNLNGYDVKVYSIAQASLFMCLILSAAFALLSNKTFRVFIILSAGSLFHLLLDSTQIKWANGVNLFAPVSWDMTNFNLFWPENLVTYILTISGIIFFLINWQFIKEIERPFFFVRTKLIISVFILLTYFSLPVILMEQIEQNDLHYLTTLRNYKERFGKYIELDRKIISYNNETRSTWINAYDGQTIELSNIPILSSTKLSIKGEFITNELIHVTEYHENWAIFRDGASYVGLFMIGLIWIIVLVKEFSKRHR